MRIVVALVVLVAIGVALTWGGWRTPAPEGAVPDPARGASGAVAPAGAAIEADRRDLVPQSLEQGMLVRVVDASGVPVGGAEVRHSLLEPRVEDGPVDHELWRLDPAAAAVRFGSVLRADGRGEVVVPVSDSVTAATESWLYVCAVDADRLAEGWLRWRDARGSEMTLRLELDREFVVQLLDHAGLERPDARAQLVAQGRKIVLGLTPGDGAALPSGGRVRSRAAGGACGHYRPPVSRCVRDGDTFRAAVTAPGTYEVGAELRHATGRVLPLRVTPARLVVPPDGARATISLGR